MYGHTYVSPLMSHMEYMLKSDAEMYTKAQLISLSMFLVNK